MNQFQKLYRWAWSILVVSALAFAMGGCSGDDGAQGPQGIQGEQGPQGDPGVDATADPIAMAVADANVESCNVCHAGAGDYHQAEYDAAYGPSSFELRITDVTSVANIAGGFDLTIDFEIDHMGAPLIDPVGSPPSVDSVGMRPVEYDGTAFQQVGPSPFPAISTANAASNGDGSYTLTTNVPYDVNAFNSGAIVGTVYDGAFSFPDNPYTGGGSVQAYEDLATSAFQVGINPLGWNSVANVDGCVKCHGAPYRKHGNIQAAVDGAPAFAQCKTCHFDNRVGGHEDWQYMLDDPLNWATGQASTFDYSYIANLKNVTHMSHAMELPYPQSMANCVTCHEGNIAAILDDANFTAQTCKSCHVENGVGAWPEAVGATPAGLYAQDHRPPPMAYLWAKAGVEGFHDYTLDCQQCHDGSVPAITFDQYHTGYDTQIYNAAGEKYSDLYYATIESVSMAGDVMTIRVTTSDAEVAPYLYVSLYGYDTKNFIVPSHDRDSANLRLEFTLGSDDNAIFTSDPANTATDFTVYVDLAAYGRTPSIPELIADGTVKAAQVSVNPRVTLADGTRLALESANAPYDIVGSVFPADWFTGVASTVDNAKCNACHDTLGSSTFHTGNGRGAADDSGATVCKHCHNTTYGGSHWEMQSRSIDAYVHAAHRFQPRDEDEVFAANDPVFNARNALHKEHTFPNFTILSCEGCHNEGTYNVPDQSKSMPSLMSGSWEFSQDMDFGRNIGKVPEAVQGAASRGCGSCHRAEWIKEDHAGDLVAFNAHTAAFGTYVANDPDVDELGNADPILWGIIDKIMSYFQ
jgi:OmcA/MtrC family decaheme c-type cytochrome